MTATIITSATIIIASLCLLHHHFHRRRIRTIFEVFNWLDNKLPTEQEIIIKNANDIGAGVSINKEPERLKFTRNNTELILVCGEENSLSGRISFRLLIADRRLTNYATELTRGRASRLYKIWRKNGPISDRIQERIIVRDATKLLKIIAPPSQPN